MKKKDYLWSLLAIVMAATLSVSLSSCGDDDDDPEPPTLTVEKTSVSFSAGGGTASIAINSNTAWSVTGGDNWLTVTKSSNTVNLTASKNESTEEKQTTITVRTDDGSLSQPITVTIEGAEQVLELSGLDAPFEKTDNTQQNAQELTITCNAGWEISGKPDWLNISNLRGTGNMIVKVWPNSVNNSTERKATIVVKSGNKEVNKEVVQKGVSSAYARPKDIVTLTESLVFGYDFSYDIHSVYFTVMTELAANGFTDTDIQQSIATGKVISTDDSDTRIESGNITWIKRTPEQFKKHGGYFSWADNFSSTNNILISVAYTSQNEIGEINRTPITLPIDDIYHSPYIDIDDINVSIEVDNGQTIYRITSTKGSQHSAYANKYYSWAVVGTKMFETWMYWYYKVDAIIAYLILQEIKKNPAPHDTYINGTDRSEIRERLEGPVDNVNFTLPANYYNDQYLQVVHWCTLSNGDFSGRISDYMYNVNGTSSSRKPSKVPVSQKSSGKTPKIIQFDPQELKKKYKVIKLN